MNAFRALGVGVAAICYILVGCEVDPEVLKSLEGKQVLVVVNEDERGNASTIECNTQNNTDRILIEKCASDIEIVN